MFTRLLTDPKTLILKDSLKKESDLHIVGGAIRDVILGFDPKDIDFSTVYPPEVVEHCLKSSGIPYVVTGIRRGTITAIIDNQPVEITTFRNPENEKEYVNSIMVDLAARDFSINAMAINVFADGLIDPYKGYNDLNNNILVAVGEAERRFTEDPHRILRMIRFGPGQGRTVDRKTYIAASKLYKLTENISIERVHDELIKIVCSKNPSNCIRMLHALNILNIFLPEVAKTVGVSQNLYHLYDVFEHSLNVMEIVPNEKLLRLAALFHDVGKPQVLSIDSEGIRHFYDHEKIGSDLTRYRLKELKFSNEDVESISMLVKKHGFETNTTRSGIRRLIRSLGEPTLRALLVLKYADLKAGHTLDYFDEIKNFELAMEEELCFMKANNFLKLSINGQDILNMGIKEGPKVGNILNTIKDLVTENPELNNRSYLLEYIKGVLLNE